MANHLRAPSHPMAKAIDVVHRAVVAGLGVATLAAGGCVPLGAAALSRGAPQQATHATSASCLPAPTTQARRAPRVCDAGHRLLCGMTKPLPLVACPRRRSGQHRTGTAFALTREQVVRALVLTPSLLQLVCQQRVRDCQQHQHQAGCCSTGWRRRKQVSDPAAGSPTPGKK